MTAFCLARAGFDLLEDTAFFILIAQHPSLSGTGAGGRNLYLLKFALLVPWLLWLAPRESGVCAETGSRRNLVNTSPDTTCLREPWCILYIQV